MTKLPTCFIAAVVLACVLIDIHGSSAAPTAPRYCWLHFGPEAKAKVLVRVEGKAVTLVHYSDGKPNGHEDRSKDASKWKEVTIRDPDGKTTYKITNVTVHA